MRWSLPIGTRVEVERRPGPPWSVRRLLNTVAVVAVILGGWIGVARLLILQSAYRVRAAQHASDRALILASPAAAAYWEARWTDQRSGLGASPPWPAGPPFVPAIADYHDRMRAKWERAALLPWLPVEPDAWPSASGGP